MRPRRQLDNEPHAQSRLRSRRLPASHRLHRRTRTTPEVLAALCSAHPAAIPFENIDPLLGRPPSLKIGDIQAKLVGAQRGGYCFEHNALLRQALLAIGFGVTSLAARVVWMAPPSLPVRPRTHMLLMVEVPGDATGPHIVDAGFGGHLIDVPLKLEPDLVQASPGEPVALHESSRCFHARKQAARRLVAALPIHARAAVAGRLRASELVHRDASGIDLPAQPADGAVDADNACKPAERPAHAAHGRPRPSGAAHRVGGRVRSRDDRCVRPAPAGAGRPSCSSECPRGKTLRSSRQLCKRFAKHRVPTLAEFHLAR